MKGKSVIIMLIVLVVLVSASLIFYKNALRPAVHRSFTSMGEVMVVGLEGVEDLNITLPPLPPLNCTNETIFPTCLTNRTIIFKSEQQCKAGIIMCDADSLCIMDNKTKLADCEIWNKEKWERGYESDSSMDSCQNLTCPDRCDGLSNFKAEGECIEEYNKCLYHVVYLHDDYPELCPANTNNTPETPYNHTQQGGSPLFNKQQMSDVGVTGAVVFGTTVVNAKSSTIIIFAMVVIVGLTVAYFKMPKKKRKKR
jgi:hypothetical protein